MSDRHSSILVILLVNSISLFVEKYIIERRRRKSEIAFHRIVECRPVVLCRVHTESVQGQNLEKCSLLFNYLLRQLKLKFLFFQADWDHGTAST